MKYLICDKKPFSNNQKFQMKISNCTHCWLGIIFILVEQENALVE